MTAQQRLRVQRYLASKRNGNRHRQRVDGEKIACEVCGSTSDLEWHHRKYWSEGGDDSPGNRQALCQPCHFAVHGQKGDFRKFGQWDGLVPPTSVSSGSEGKASARR